MAASDLGTRDLRAILDIVYALNDQDGEVEMGLPIIAELGALVGCESTFYSGIDHTGQLRHVVDEQCPGDVSHLPGFHAAIGQHPGFIAGRSGRLAPGVPVALTDLADLPSLRRLPIYTDFCRPSGITDQLICVLQRNSGLSTALLFNRNRVGFSRRDRAVAALLGSHVTQGVARRRRLASLNAAVQGLVRRDQRTEQALLRMPTLTARERQVVEHIASGCDDRQAARNLGISPRTVQKHLEHVYGKLGVSGRTRLIAAVQGVPKHS